MKISACIAAAIILCALAPRRAAADPAAIFVGDSGDNTVPAYSTTGAAATGYTAPAGFSSVEGVAYNPANNTLYAADFNGQIRTFNATTGAETQIGFAQIARTSGVFGLALNAGVLYAANASTSTVTAYNAATGAVVTSGFTMPATLNRPEGLAVNATTLFVTDALGKVGAFDLATGAAVPGFTTITGLGLAGTVVLFGNDLFVADEGNSTVGEYDATTGAAINANFLPGIVNGPFGLAVLGNRLLVTNNNNNTVGAYGIPATATVGNVPTSFDPYFLTGLKSPLYIAVASSGSVPTITTQPASQSSTAGSTVTFSVVASGPAPLTYQWYFDGAAISGATDSSLTLPGITSANAGSYDVVVTDSVGSVMSSIVTLTVASSGSAPTITTQPASQSVVLGNSATFSVVASGTGNLSYQWYKDGAAIAGATGASYKISAATSDSAGSYDVVVTDSVGSVMSSIATLTVAPSGSVPTITTQPASQSSTAGSTVTFSVVASGPAPLTYQWYFDGAAISGATDSSLTLPGITSANAGSYDVVVTDADGPVTSSKATLTVTSTSSTAPSITTQPVSQTAAVGSSVTFTVAASGSDTLSYQWYKGHTLISGATGAAYTIASVTDADAGSYDVVVTNSVGSATSDTATLTVTEGTPTVSVTTGNNIINAGEGKKGIVIFTRSGGDTTSELTVNFKVKGSATYGIDYKETGGNDLGSSITFPAGTTKIKVKLKGINDGTATSIKKVVIKLVASSTGAYTIGDSDRAKLTLVDNEE